MPRIMVPPVYHGPRSVENGHGRSARWISFAAMPFGRIPAPLDDGFREVLVEIARAHRLPSLAEPKRLAPHVTALTAAYNDASLRGLVGVDHRAARLGFFFARDVPKIAGAVREAIAI